MPRKKVRIKKRIEPIESWIIEYFISGKIVNPSSKLAAWEFKYDNLPAKSELWKKHKEGILEDFISKHPGKRPYFWWEVDAPRWTENIRVWTTANFDDEFPQPRKRIGGIGTPAYEVLAYKPSFSFGIPTSYVDASSVAYYNGIARDIHGELIPSKYKEGDFKGVAIDPDDLPVYESQAAYLKRHNLLTKSEEKRLTDRDFEPESCIKYVKTYDD